MRVSLLGLLLVGACAPRVPFVTPVDPPAPDEATLLAQTLPAVVLLLANRADGTVRYGAGLVLDAPRPGLVLTTFELVNDATALHAVRYDSLFARDDSVARLAVEHAQAVVAATLVRADVARDLAVVRLDAETRSLPRLSWRDAPPVKGERVLALGHPARRPWLATAGALTKVEGPLMMDTAGDPGTIGGPLVDTHGRVLGLVHRDGSASPIEFARGLIDEAALPIELDRRTPEAAYRTCLRAAQSGSERWLECLEYDDVAALLTEARAKAKTSSVPATREEARQVALVNFRRAVGFPTEPLAAQTVEQLTAQLSSAAAAPFTPDEQLFSRTGIKVDAANPRGAYQLLRLGVELGRVAPVDERRAWLETVGRNVDGSRWAEAELWVKGLGGWVRREAPSVEDEATRPADFAKQSMTAAELLAAYVEAENRRR